MRKINYTTTLNASEVDALRTIARKDFGGNVSAAMRAIIVTEAARRGLAAFDADPGAAAPVAPTGEWSNDAPSGQMTVMPYDEFIARYGTDED